MIPGFVFSVFQLIRLVLFATFINALWKVKTEYLMRWSHMQKLAVTLSIVIIIIETLLKFI